MFNSVKFALVIIIEELIFKFNYQYSKPDHLHVCDIEINSPCLDGGISTQDCIILTRVIKSSQDEMLTQRPTTYYFRSSAILNEIFWKDHDEFAIKNLLQCIMKIPNNHNNCKMIAD